MNTVFDHGVKYLVGICLLVMISACSTPDPYVTSPMQVPVAPSPNYIEHIHTGAIFQPGMQTVSLFSSERRPRAIGDTLKIQIVESTKATRDLNTSTIRANKVASKGPGGGGGKGGLINRLLDIDAEASGSDSFKGAGSTDNTSTLNAEITASVINVLPNGHLAVAGEKGVALNGGVSTLRVSGVVNPNDIGPGNIVSSVNMLNARYELGGQGDVSDAATRNWLQRFLTKHMTIW